jgi:hypothetical protein
MPRPRIKTGQDCCSAEAIIIHVQPAMGTSKNSKISFSLRANLCKHLSSGENKPSPKGEGWVTTARMQEVGQRREQLPRGNKLEESHYFIPLIPSFSRWRRGAITCVDTCAHWERVFLGVPL